MKKLFTLICSLGIFSANAQTTIYSQDFNASSSTPAGWTLMSGDLGGVTSVSGNQWIINNVYTAGPFGTPTNTQPAGITGSPSSNYLHINCGPTLESLYGSNCNFNSLASGDTYFAIMSTPVVTTGYTSVTLTFWWLCNGSAVADGKIYYRTSASGPWTLITTPISSYFGSSSWAMQTVTMAAFDNQAALEFGFQFRDEMGSDPAFAVDDIKITGIGGSPSPVASMTANHTTICSDSAVIFTNTSTGTASIDSFTWTAGGAPVTGGTGVSPLTINFPDAGTFPIKLYLHDGGIKIDSATTTITVKQSPSPVIVKTGSILSISGAYTSYQWYNGLTQVAGATNSSYTFTTPGLYGVLVDSNGCKGISIINTLAVGQIGGTDNTIWIDQQQSNALSLISMAALDAPLVVTVYDATGRTIAKTTWAQGTRSLQVADIAATPGIYMVRLSNDFTAVTLRWLKH